LFALKIFALWLAFKIRKVKITGLNDSKFIVSIIYITTILLAVCALIYFTLYTRNLMLYTILFSSITYSIVTIILGLTFIPKAI